MEAGNVILLPHNEEAFIKLKKSYPNLLLLKTRSLVVPISTQLPMVEIQVRKDIKKYPKSCVFVQK